MVTSAWISRAKRKCFPALSLRAGAPKLGLALKAQTTLFLPLIINIIVFYRRSRYSAIAAKITTPKLNLDSRRRSIFWGNLGFNARHIKCRIKHVGIDLRVNLHTLLNGKSRPSISLV